jgi:competence protein ComEA
MVAVRSGLAAGFLGALLLALAASAGFAEQKSVAPQTEVAKVNINQASQEELEGVRWIGPVLAKRIIEHRGAHGPFKSVEDLIQVPGIGEVKFQKIKDQITVEKR